jgi:hypothetical protein
MMTVRLPAGRAAPGASSGTVRVSAIARMAVAGLPAVRPPKTRRHGSDQRIPSGRSAGPGFLIRVGAAKARWGQAGGSFATLVTPAAGGGAALSGEEGLRRLRCPRELPVVRP